MMHWCKRHAATLAIGLAVSTLLLLAAVVVQALMLYKGGWRIAWGTAPEWLSGFGGLGAAAAFGALWFAAQEWKTAQAERRDQEADQARLVVVEFKEEAPLAGDLSTSRDRDVVVCNRSNRHVLDVDIDPLGGDSDLVVFRNFSAITRSIQARPGQFTPQRIPVLHAEAATDPLTVIGGSRDVPPIEHITFSFTDAAGRRWRRTGTGQPKRASS